MAKEGKRPVGRPPKLKADYLQQLLEEFITYVDETDIPIVSRFAANHRLNKQFFYDRPEFSDVLKWCMAKKEAGLEEGALKGLVKEATAIFSLKANHGWRDREAKVLFVDPKTLSDDELKKLISEGQ